MDRKQWARVREVFRAALASDPGDRGALLDRECGEDAELRARVEAYLGADREIGEDFLEPLAGLSLRPAHPAPTDDRLVGTRIGQYTLTRVLSSGGMGTVYEAEQEHPRRTVAVKVMRAGLASPAAQRRFEYESEILASLRHPGIAQVHEAGTHRENGGPGLPYFVMEYIPGARTITEYARDAKLRVRERLRLFMQVCDAVHHGHQKGIIHRDLKPGNILVDAHGHVKIIDFGVARATNSDVAATTAHTDVGQLLGTLQYMSPEQCDANPHQLDIRSDVYALGVVLYELLCEKLPYDVQGAPIHEAARVIREETPPRPSTTDRRLRGDVETIVLKALEKDRDRRYPSADELGRDIERYLAGAPILARPPSALYQLRKFARRHWVVVGGVATVFVVLLAGIIVSTTMFVRSERARAKADREAKASRAINAFYDDMLAKLSPTPIFGVLDEVMHASFASREDFEMTDAVVEMLRTSISGIEEAFGGKPEEEAVVRERIGVALFRLGAGSDARKQLEAALALHREAYGDEDPDTLRLQVTLATLLNIHFQFQDALAILRPTWEAMRRVLGADHPDTLLAERILSATLVNLKQLDEADRVLGPTIETHRRVFGPEDRRTVRVMIIRSVLLFFQLRFRECLDVAGEAYDICQEHFGPDDAVTIDSERWFAAHLMEANQLARAREVVEPAYEKSMRVAGKAHPQTLNLTRILAHTLVGDEDVERRERLFQQVLDGCRKTYGEGAWLTNRTFANFANHLAGVGKYDEVEEMVRDVYRRSVETLGEEHAWTVTMAGVLADVLIYRGKLDEGEEACLHWVDLVTKAHGAGTPDALEASLKGAQMLSITGRLEPARRIIADALTAGRAWVESPDTGPADLGAFARFLLSVAWYDDVYLPCAPGEHRDPAAALDYALRAVEASGRKDVTLLATLAMAYDANGNPSMAVSVQTDALRAITQGAIWDRFSIERELARYRIHAGETDEALRRLRESYATLRENQAESSILVANRMFDDAWLLVEEGEFGYGEELARRFIELESEGTFPGRTWPVCAAEVLTGRCLAASGRYEEAETYLLGGYEGMRDSPIMLGQYRTRALEWLVEFYDDWGKPDQAAAWRAEMPPR